MKISLTLLSALLFTILAHGQSLQTESSEINTFKAPGLTTIDKNPLVIVVVDSDRIKVKNIEDYDINPKWIESIDVLKDSTSKKIYGSKNGVIIMYIKKKYRKKAIKELNKTIPS